YCCGIAGTLLLLLHLYIELGLVDGEAILAADELREVEGDDLGREVVLPADITRIAPSGSNAQVIVFQIAPEKLVGLSTKLSADEKTIYPSFTHDLPAFGTLYGKKANLNKETMILANPEMVIDVGDIKGSVEEMAKELDDVSRDVGVPVIFLEANMDNYPEVFRRLGKLLGYEERAEELAGYYEAVVSEIEKYSSGKKPTVYITSSNNGLEAVIGGKSHAQCAEKAGAEVVVTSKTAQSNGSISLETLYQLDPDYIFAYTEEGYKTITTSSDWASLKAVKDGNVYLVPNMPHGFIDNPVCSNRIIGLWYLAWVLYPEAGIDIIARTCEFYKLFYRADITESQARDILHLD
ncbi:MAG: ABC transporter substrate-binding protein, partial [Spirochaetales bacterium]|nr:ABC transporter substrate-binding protein [Spirochaetales bacterium]